MSESVRPLKAVDLVVDIDCDYYPPTMLKIYDEASAPTEITMDESFLGQFIPIHYHCNMLLDQVRISSFREAIEYLTPDGGKVLELGGGTGVLSYFAAQKASQVWCVERNPELVAASRKFLEQNKNGNRVEVIQSDARDFLPPERVDVVICEMLHVALVREKQIEIIKSFQDRYLDCFGPPLPKFVPEASLLAIQPVQQSFDFDGYNAPILLFQSPCAENQSTRGLCQPNIYATVEYGRSLPKQFHVHTEFTVTQDGCFNAVRLITKNILAFHKVKGSAMEWSNQYLVLPLDEPLNVKAGEMITASIQYEAGCEFNPLQAGIKAYRKSQHSSKVTDFQRRAA